MDFIDYREKLGVGLRDVEKAKMCYTKLFNVRDGLDDGYTIRVSFKDYYAFCNDTGTEMNLHIIGENDDFARFTHCISILSSHRNDIKEFLAYYVWFANSLKDIVHNDWDGKSFINLLTRTLIECHLSYSLIEIDGQKLVFPKGAKELDDALVSEPLEWLKDYPKAHKTYCIALKQYADGIYIRDVADNLRKALEEFLQEFLGNSKNLETNKTEICKYLGTQGVDAGITGLFQPLINSYKNINDRIAKHNDAVDDKLLEFLLYQTGVLIRMVISIKQNEGETGEKK